MDKTTIFFYNKENAGAMYADNQRYPLWFIRKQVCVTTLVVMMTKVITTNLFLDDH
jgi:hypothetical protein